MNPISAAGSVVTAPCFLCVLATTSISTQADVTDLSALTPLVRRSAQGSLPQYIFSLFVVAKLLPMKQRLDVSWPVATDQALQHLVSKVLPPAGFRVSAELLASEQLANGVRAGKNAIVHDVRMLAERCGHCTSLLCVSTSVMSAVHTCLQH